MAEEDAEVVHPGSGKENVVVVSEPLAEAAGERVKAGLMAELIHRAGFGANVVDDGLTPVWGGHRAGPDAAAWESAAGHLGVMRMRSRPPRSTVNGGAAAGMHDGAGRIDGSKCRAGDAACARGGEQVGQGGDGLIRFEEAQARAARGDGDALDAEVVFINRMVRSCWITGLTFPARVTS